jgi:hypothetical protein
MEQIMACLLPEIGTNQAKADVNLNEMKEEIAGSHDTEQWRRNAGQEGSQDGKQPRKDGSQDRRQ